ncbi:MAG: galactokinase family protein, partial [Desulfobacteraceae bacterium]
MPLINSLIDLFHTHYPAQVAPRLFRAPGRVNLIGDHTDYNEGFVLPAAIDRHIVIAAAPRNDDKVNVYAQNFDQWDCFDVKKEIPKLSENHWGNYLRAMVWSLKINGFTPMGM